MKHWLYLKYLLRHKWYVFLAGNRMGVSLWRLIKHDWSKVTPTEWWPYAYSFYGPYKYRERPEWLVNAFDAAWLHHQHWNDHHWQHWVLREDSGALKILEMPLCCTAEMVADWAGAGRAITGTWEVQSWYEKNKEKIQLHPVTRIITERMLDAYFPKPI